MIIEKALAEKNYGDYSADDYLNAEQNELTVTITLHEYRDLIKAKIKSEIQKEKLDWYEQYSRANKAEAEVKKLRANVEALKSAIRGDANPSNEEE